MALLFLAAFVVVMAMFAGYHFAVGLLVAGLGIGLSALASKIIFSLLGTPALR